MGGEQRCSRQVKERQLEDFEGGQKVAVHGYAAHTEKWIRAWDANLLNNSEGTPH